MMKEISFLIFLFYLSTAYSGNIVFGNNGFFLGKPSKDTSSIESPTENFFDQVYDHFYYGGTEYWKQRYYVNDKYYEIGGPVFIMVIGKDASNWAMEGAWIEYAKKFKALCFVLEHRYYGKSHAKEDLSTKNLFFNTIESGLADVTSFKVLMTEKYNLSDKTKWIAFGGSYSGSLAAWLRIKYPHIIDGAISSSAPIMAKADFNEYFEMVTRALAQNSYKCVESIQKAFKQVEALIQSKEKSKVLDDKFKLCDPIENSLENSLDISNFFNHLANYIGNVVQYNNVNSPRSILSINDACTIMNDETIKSEIDRLATLVNTISEKKKRTCFEYKYDKMVEELKLTSWDSKASKGSRQWLYQTCHELGFYRTSTNKTDIFGDRLPLNFFTKKCEDVFGPVWHVTKGVDRTNLYYGGLGTKTTNVLYIVNGNDPWKTLTQPTESIDSNEILVIEGTAHCADVYEPSSEDSAELVEARQRIISYIEILLNSE